MRHIKLQSDYSCYYKHYTSNSPTILVQNNNTACWAGLRAHFEAFSGSRIYSEASIIPESTIYINDFRVPETEEYIELLIGVINEITPCKLLRKGSQIKFKLLDSYDKSLILLNFIRNLWHDPCKGYSICFFKNLEKSEEKDPLARLTSANKEACAHLRIVLQPGHSNCNNHNHLVVRKTKDLLEGSLTSTRDFLSGK